ncbi:hypothetical protein CBI38_36140 (plasmid) [Rhodococcus oxybenzonivorans]|uniref:Uncharacterized protein n=2 Tax=Rhodococcus oxybenzonivorans TaxID=1990687 RepID=A0A2S2C7I5_9NOCA|nr:hypothetical protein CBI38_36140 [Rhodococcus oxybenzonivorans]
MNARILAKLEVCPLLVTAPGGTAVRLSIERSIREYGWRLAASGAEANILVVAGLEHDTVESYVRVLWKSMPEPRIRVDISDLTSSISDLADAAARLRSGVHQTANHTPSGTNDNGVDAPAGQPDGERDPHNPHHGHNMDMEDRDAPDHTHHGHNMASMEMPGGIPMADRAEDRDGLKLDVLTVPFGPATPHWPTGLLIQTKLQGDVIQKADVSALAPDRPDDAFWLQPWVKALAGDPISISYATRRLIAYRLDSCATLLSVVGWDYASITASRLRDNILSGPLASGDISRLRRWTNRVMHSRVLRWSLSGLGAIRADPTTPTRLAGDALDRLRTMLTEILDALPHLDDAAPLISYGFAAEQRSDVEWILDSLPNLLLGTELAETRLIVASLDPDVEALAIGRHHG